MNPPPQPEPSRSWPCWTRPTEHGWYPLCLDPRAYAMTGFTEPAVLARLVEDPDGEYLGWLPARQPERLCMVQHARIFGVQFPQGHQAEIAAGRGQAVRLRVDASDD